MDPRPPIPGWERDLALVVLGTFLMCTAQFLLMPVMPLLVVGPLRGDSANVGFAVGAFSVTALLSRPFVGWMLDRFGRRALLIGGAAAAVPCMAAYGLLASLGSLIGLRLLHGLIWGLVTVAMATVAADLVPARHRGLGMGIYGLAMPLAMAVGPLLGSALLGPDRFTRVFTTGTCIAVLGAVAYLGVRIPPLRDPQARLRPDRMFEPRVGWVALVLLPLCVGFGGWMTFLPLYAPTLGMRGAGPLFFWYAMGSLGSRLFAGRWYDRSGASGPGALAVVLVLAGWLSYAGPAQAELAMLGSALLGLGFGVAGTVFLAMAVDMVEPDRRGAATATVFSAYDVSIGGGAVVFGALTDLAAVREIFLVAAASTLLAGAILAWRTLPHFRTHRLGL